MASDSDEKAEAPTGRVMKPCDVPLYGFPKEAKPNTATPAETGLLVSGISTVRKTLQEAMAPLKAAEGEVSHIYQTGKAHTAATYEQMLQPENAPMRFAFIGVAGLFGYAMGAIRGRMPRKLLYATVAGGGAAAACYPKEATALSQEAIEEGTKMGNIAYNFLLGAQPGADEDKDKKEVQKSPAVGGDPGQSNPADKDMYTTRDKAS